VLSRVVKTVSYRRSLFLQDQDAVVRTIANEHGVGTPAAQSASVDRKSMASSSGSAAGGGDEDDSEKENDGIGGAAAHFSFIITRPTVLLNDGPATKKLSASKSVRQLFRFEIHNDLYVHPLTHMQSSSIHRLLAWTSFANLTTTERSNRVHSQSPTRNLPNSPSMRSSTREFTTPAPTSFPRATGTTCTVLNADVFGMATKSWSQSECKLPLAAIY